MLDCIVSTIEEITGKKHHTSSVWRSLHKNERLSKKSTIFLWKGVHEAHKVGRYWEHTPVKDTFMPCDHCDIPEESIEHILLHCKASGQETVWKLAESLWRRVNRTPWPHISIGLILGIGLVEVKSNQHAKLPLTGPTRLLQILISESAYLIWVLRCEWRIGMDADPSKIHTPKEIRARWNTSLLKRMRQDAILTNRRAYGRKALKKELVEDTWEGVKEALKTITERERPAMGVLVGDERTRGRPR
jgi:hypothetical protein